MLLLASYMLVISEEDDKAELALSLLMLGQALLVHQIKSMSHSRRYRKRGPDIKDRTQHSYDRIINRESETIFKTWFR
jgi:hypothetical protein